MRVSRVPLAANAELSITPKGEVNYSVDIRYRRKVDQLKAEATNGMTLTREYLDEAGKPKTSFTVGDVVVVRVHSKLKESSNYVMVSDALPAGFEAINTRLATSDSSVKQTEDWGTYREMRDDRVNFTSEWARYGDYTHEFTMRATSVGKFARPPTTVELMYEPETHAQTAFDVIEIKAK
jgi:uncharacterized protein YfaS (alpha-2-macroglobulin family)